MTLVTITQKETLTVPALKCHQQEYEFFAFILTAEQLAQISYVSSREGKDGYQRLLLVDGVLTNNVSSCACE
jgi:hypothetical protein